MSDDSQTTGSQDMDQMYQLPNGMSAYHLNKHETDFIYKEIFEDQIYLKHGINLKDNACIFDVGANIGLFVMFAKQISPNARIFAFEPAPDICRLLRLNTAQYGSSTQVHQCGISDEEKKTTFTYYPNYSILSGFHADPKDDKQILSAGVRKSKSIHKRGMSDRLVELIVDKLIEARQFECQLRTISSILRESGVERVDLLKIDAEKSEAQVLDGIEECDWAKIDQIVMETHSEHQAEYVVSLLNAKGFKVSIEQEEQFATSGITNIFAVRPCKEMHDIIS